MNCKCGGELEEIAETAGVTGYFESSVETMNYYSCKRCQKLYQGKKTRYSLLAEESTVKQSEIEQYEGPLTKKDIISSARYYGEKITTH